MHVIHCELGPDMVAALHAWLQEGRWTLAEPVWVSARRAFLAMGIGVAGPQWHALAAGCWSRLMVGRIVFHGRWVAILLTLVLASACSLLEQSARLEAPVHALAPGPIVWLPERAPAGPVELVVSLASPRPRVVRPGNLTGPSTH